MKPQIKFCGITNLVDLGRAVELKVEFVGFNFYPKSSRYIAVEQAAELAKHLPPEVRAVGVFVDASLEEVRRAEKQVPLSLLQFHGNEDSAYLANWRAEKLIRAVRLGEDESSMPLHHAAEQAYFVLLDRLSAGVYGGSGETISESSVTKALNVIPPERIFLSGGLTPENVAAKFARFRPYAVDVASGIEEAPGQKSAEKMESFVRALRSGGDSYCRREA